MSDKELKSLGSFVNQDRVNKVEKDKKYYEKKLNEHTRYNKKTNKFKNDDKDENENPKVRKRMPIKDYIIFLLSRREYSTKEIETKLKNREHTEEEIKEALEWAITSGYQSNSRFAVSHAKNRSLRRGDRGLKYEMKMKGMSDDDIENAMNEVEPEIERVLYALQKYKGKNLTDIKLKEKAFRSLAGKGFSFNSIKSAWEQFVNDNNC